MNEIKKTIGFIGLGVMGKSMSRNLLGAGYEVLVYSRTKEKCKDILAEGAIWNNTAKEIAENADIIITMVGYPHDVEEVYFGNEGIFTSAKKSSVLVDMTTSTPTLAKKIYEEAKRSGLYALDAPVSGGDVGAKNGTLSIMVGGDRPIFDELFPIFEILGGNIVYQGEAGAGQHTKMCNQIAIASNMIGVTEALVYAKNAGLNPESVLKSIGSGAAGSWSMANLIPRVLKEDYSPGFFIKHFIKDMGIALEEAEKMNLQLPGLELAKKMYDTLASHGEENSGTQALIKYWNHGYHL
ncbi:NAD(P)-dependent oxidoreductase [Lederbergia citrea]|uniref:NAD(P)-dependent oxidoreductase n=1 Tax=Lederbergia citrea TaxID=2833581 RepID=A0A942Z463_9BACI|nr:NAD(P)-dependent oxidoreductase [Lederbergia citrea]MBS4177307.1 NAD(P)-dependent oxidoreductase [Lederbergia citrea]MBS4203970.1 NAD(P)-dependent oxidoreductase [Lederbergia citrea]MBS4221446.1 NAD(P)-dependent oxidoreductase [Lederbergia citrea]